MALVLHVVYIDRKLAINTREKGKAAGAGHCWHGHFRIFCLEVLFKLNLMNKDVTILYYKKQPFRKTKKMRKILQEKGLETKTL